MVNSVRLGRLHLNAGGLCPIRARAIMEYWQIDELLLGESNCPNNPHHMCLCPLGP